MKRLPARLSLKQAAPLLGFSEHDIPILISGKLLKPLGHPAENAVKYFSSNELEKIGQEREWLDRATQAVYKHWARKNQKRKPKAFVPGIADTTAG